MQLFANILLGILTIHNADFIHRDLNPKNIFIKNFKDDRELLIIGDFGTVKSSN
jgi:serine/threonine protein kinase